MDLFARYGLTVATSSGAVILKTAHSSLSASNRTTHNYTYTFESTVQNGKIALIVLFVGDDGDEGMVDTDSVAQLHRTTLSDPGCIWIGYYIPSQGDLNTGTIDFSFETESSEIFQFIVYEVDGLDLSNAPSSLLADTASDESNVDRASTNSVQVTADAGDLLITVCIMDAASTSADLTTTTANGFTAGTYLPPGGGSINGFAAVQAAHLIAPTAGDYDSPVFANSISEEMSVLVVALSAA